MALPSPIDGLAEPVVEVYAEAERQMLALMARYLAKGKDVPNWAEVKLAEVQFLQRQMRRLVADMSNRAASEVALSLARAYNRGGAQAAADLAALLKVSLEEASAPLRGLPPVESLVAETMGYLGSKPVQRRILRATTDAYRSIVAQSAAQILTGTQTRLAATQAALDRFAAAGLRGFRDSAGRDWSMETYAEMATRTAANRAFKAATLDRFAEYDIDLVIVPDTPGSCELCQPWEGEVLSISGESDKYPSVEEAEGAGLGHPNCTHRYSAYQEGVTREYDPTLSEAENAELYANQQKLRYLERKTREAKRLEAAAMSPEAKRAARAKVRARQAQIREHVDRTGVRRQNYREQVRA